jgi:LmbE family N-acetylglucosaminyl deacetylase
VTVVVLSPHLDDAALSLGATIAALVKRKIDVAIVTVFSGDPSYVGPPSAWDIERGAVTAGEVFLQRREEDRLACDALGARPVWLPFVDDGYGAPREPVAIWEQLGPVLAGADAVFIPGFPVAHPDHRLVADLVLEHRSELTCMLGYRELPYALLPRHLFAQLRSGGWTRAKVHRADRVAKRAACRHFQLEFAGFGAMAKLARRFETVVGCESIAHLHGEVPDALNHIIR